VQTRHRVFGRLWINIVKHAFGETNHDYAGLSKIYQKLALAELYR
jgi:hypothetical protein